MGAGICPRCLESWAPGAGTLAVSHTCDGQHLSSLLVGELSPGSQSISRSDAGLRWAFPPAVAGIGWVLTLPVLGAVPGTPFTQHPCPQSSHTCRVQLRRAGK